MVEQGSSSGREAAMDKTSQIHHRETTLITGASGGIGYELTKLFAKDGYNLVLVARSRDKLLRFAEELKQEFGISVKVIPKDLSISTAPEEIFSELQQESTHIDILVNNAGFDAHGLFSESALDVHLEMMQVNVASPTHLTRLFLPAMVEKGKGKILNVASMLSLMPAPHQAVYGASKAYVLSFSEALAEELRGSGVSVTALCPGITLTDLHARAGMSMSKMPGFMKMEAEPVARAGYRGLMKNRRVVIPGLVNKMSGLLLRVSPRSSLTRIYKRVSLRLELE
jgi:short-subunit dehydrogenase